MLLWRSSYTWVTPVGGGNKCIASVSTPGAWQGASNMQPACLALEQVALLIMNVPRLLAAGAVWCWFLHMTHSHVVPNAQTITTHIRVLQRRAVDVPVPGCCGVVCHRPTALPPGSPSPPGQQQIRWPRRWLTTSGVPGRPSCTAHTPSHTR